MMKKWKEFSNVEKSYLLIAFILLIAIALSWKRVSKGVMKGLDKQQTEQKP